ncbi:MAG: long-chain acyl-CoA synthetase, partial [Frankiaceae bacterium]|nr:long-chain acyl-CoA synthetase [Frankiaceae bacterium]
MRTADTTFGEVSTMTLPELFERRVEETPDSLAVHSAQGDMTFAGWWTRALSIADLLTASFGSLRGERVALWFTNDEAMTYVSTLQSVFEVGAISMGLDDRYAVPELQRLFDLAEPRVLVIGPQLAERLGPEGFAELGLDGSPPAPDWDALVLPIEGRLIAGAPTPWASGDTDGALSPSRVAAPADDAMIAFTSGSTGTPKGPIWSQAAVCQYAERVSHCTYAVPRAGKALSDRDVLQSPVPLYTAASLIENIYPTVFSGCQLVFEGRRFDAAASEERMARHGTTVYNGVPAFFAMMCDLPKRRPGPAPELMIMSGSALTEGLYRRMRQRWPTTQVANWYGLNESGTGQTLNHGPDMERHPSSIGRPLPPTEIRVVDADLNAVAVGIEGDLLMRAPGQMREYFRSPDQTAERFRGDWLFTGDRAVQDEDGLIH